MIPKKIHYCWFGKNKLSEEAQKCIASWKKYCPDYEIIEWNEDNYDINKNEYTRLTYNNKKWAFLTDYVRLDIIYNEGGIYLDTDVELLKSLDELLQYECFMGMEQAGKVATGLGFGAEKNNMFIKKNKEFYEHNKNFLKKNQKLKKIICVKVTTDLLNNNGLQEKDMLQIVNGVTIFPVEYFCPLKMGTNQLKITDNTYSIHHYAASWKSNNKVIRKIAYYLIPVKQKLKKILGKK